MNGCWAANSELTGMFRHDGMSLYDLHRTFYAKGYTFVDKFGIINKKQKTIYDANRKRIWQLDRIPTDIQTVIWKTAADYPEVVSYLRNMVRENNNLSYFNDVTDDELLNTYAGICVASNKPVRPHNNENTLTFIKYRLEDIANEKIFWRDSMAKLKEERIGEIWADISMEYALLTKSTPF